MANHNKWWGYLHRNGSIKAWRYQPGSISEAKRTPAIKKVSTLFNAQDRDEALREVRRQVL